MCLKRILTPVGFGYCGVQKPANVLTCCSCVRDQWLWIAPCFLCWWHWHLLAKWQEGCALLPLVTNVLTSGTFYSLSTIYRVTHHQQTLFFLIWSHFSMAMEKVAFMTHETNEAREEGRDAGSLKMSNLIPHPAALHYTCQRKVPTPRTPFLCPCLTPAQVQRGLYPGKHRTMARRIGPWQRPGDWQVWNCASDGKGHCERVAAPKMLSCFLCLCNHSLRSS